MSVPKIVLFVNALMFTVTSGVALAGQAANSQPPADYVDFAKFQNGGSCDALVAKAAPQGASLKSIAAGLNNGSNWKQEDLDRLFACSKAGPIPDGFHDGIVIIAPGSGLKRDTEIAAKMGIPIDEVRVKTFAEALWKGKEFHKQEGYLLNRMGDNIKPIFGAALAAGQMRFPAKLYCGQSQLDSRRESIIIDYLFSEQLPGYDKTIDWIASGNTGPSGHAGLKVRDEMRMVAPGIYLGRAYMDRLFVLNFVLYKEGSAREEGTCWDGSKVATSN